MARKKQGLQTVSFEKKPYIIGRGNVVGKKESEGPLASYFDESLTDDMYGEKSWEKAESKMLQTAMSKACTRAQLSKENIDVMLSGDLVNQIMSSSFTARNMHIPFLGLYGACSTMTESMVLGSMLIDGEFASNVLAGASSHFCTAERQFRMPVEHGNQRPPSAQWTATAAGAVVISESAGGNAPVNIRVTDATVGKVIDAGIKDANQMGAAMAPAAVDTLLNHLQDTGREIDYYDLVVTGDLGYIGKDIMCDLLVDAGLDSRKVFGHYDDCGTMLFAKDQDVHGGGSGCGCSHREPSQKNGAGRVQENPAHVDRSASFNYFSVPGRKHTGNSACRCIGGGMMDYVWAFLIGGLFCVAGQILMDTTKLTAPRILVIFVLAGVVLQAFNLYEPIVELAGNGATTPLPGFGYNLAKGAMEGAKNGFLPAITGPIKATAAGVAVAITFGYIVSLIFNPKSPKR